MKLISWAFLILNGNSWHNAHMSVLCKIKTGNMESYRFLFPLGILGALLGTLFWVPFGFGLSQNYPGIFHPNLMIGSFLLSFVSGFLMTAVPRFTQSFEASFKEIVSVFVLLVLGTLFGLLQWQATFHSIALLIFLSLVIFVARRLRRRRRVPPPFFPFIGIGLALGVLGALLLLLADFSVVSEVGTQLGRLFFNQGTVLAFVVGVGSQLIPALMGRAALPTEATVERGFKTAAVMVVLGLIFIFSFIFEAKGQVILGQGVRAILVTAVALVRWKLWLLPRRKAVHAFLIWLASLSVVLGLWIPIFFPAYTVHGLHLVFISGFGLLTFMVATRVVLSHGGHDLAVENKSKVLTTVGILIFIAAVTRIFAMSAPQSYLHHLAFAAIAWILAVLLWAAVFLPKMLRTKSKS
jgi:uncharacterized protein involved in response to NO